MIRPYFHLDRRALPCPDTTRDRGPTADHPTAGTTCAPDTDVYSGNRYAISSPANPAPLMAMTMYCRPSCR